MMRYKEEKEAEKESFRKYLESSGVVDALTKVLVALYEQNDKPSSALEFVQEKIGGPSVVEYEKLQAEVRKELEEIKDLHPMAIASSKETTDGESPKRKKDD